jgi:hypothetical protein
MRVAMDPPNVPFRREFIGEENVADGEVIGCCEIELELGETRLQHV